MIIFRIALYLATMNKQIEIIQKPRFFLLDVVHDLSNEQLNKIPDGFNNNIIWNLAHMIATQQGVCYIRAGLPKVVGEAFWQTYTSGTKPTDIVNSDEVENIKKLFISTMDQLVTDYNNQIFSNYAAWTTRSGIELRNIDEALSFIPMHEGLHVGYIMALKRVVK